ncbi:hypothetical protein PF005_g13403 [Phytophthora fragariae]|uniref:Uncharacterized protein n=1 Tax=Phytophthora fragariae TaxID=53985 RepID=A0A6A3XMY5_9STRA|nr:hypothetical protein PF009_g14683 [Phytophthora fragariae]KAE9105028.1 hypothetical protein PF007_g13843 [Phytophthora fragariae]KAE9106172.1 hypothetical protein PF010_g12714 [Phytophthora fragariae]KAE9142613.1 hypothetical protein PF006_g12292 [Phytophthora fragariae]KAE9205409.1 hypothetical protein PF005_g13403 [Phytophthora fragariae]
MLAEVARRRSSWLRSLATARRLSRPLQTNARPQEDDEEEAADGGVKRPLGRGRPAPQHFNLLLPQHAEPSPLSGGPSNAIAAASKDLATKETGEETEPQVTLQAAADAGEFPALIASGSPAAKDVQRARESLQKLARDLADPRAAVARESGYQRARRQLKATTGKLDRMLYAMRTRRDFEQVEAVAFVWEEEFPHFAGQQKHWSVISEHYALALNHQQRFQEVVDKFSSCFREQEGRERVAEAVGLLTPRLAQAIYVALGHLRDASGTLQLLDTMRRRGLHVTKVSYFHVLNALLHDESFTGFETVMQICEEIVTALPGEIVPLSLLPMVMMTAAACGESERAMKFYSHPPDMSMSVFTEFRFEICLQQLNDLGEDAMLMEMYRNLMQSSQASRDVKERVSKYLLRKRVALSTTDTRDKRLKNHRVTKVMTATMTKTTSEFTLKCGVQQISTTFSRDLVDDLFVFALDRSMPIKYAALEQVVVYYYKLGLIDDYERVSDIVHALRLNKHVPLGIAVTEIGMAANLRLHRYEEVIMLFEDFSALDGERRRVLQRQLMLKTALDAYKCLGRGDEALAIHALLKQNYGSLLDGRQWGEAKKEIALSKRGETCIDEKESDDSNSDEVDEMESDDSNSDEVDEKERLSLSRFNR